MKSGLIWCLSESCHAHVRRLGQIGLSDGRHRKCSGPATDVADRQRMILRARVSGSQICPLPGSAETCANPTPARKVLLVNHAAALVAGTESSKIFCPLADMKKPFVGLIAAPHTPFRADGEIALDTIRLQARLLAHNGVTGAFVCGTTGEGASMISEERCQVVEAWAAARPTSLALMLGGQRGNQELAPAECRALEALTNCRVEFTHRKRAKISIPIGLPRIRVAESAHTRAPKKSVGKQRERSVTDFRPGTRNCIRAVNVSLFRGFKGTRRKNHRPIHEKSQLAREAANDVAVVH